MIWSSGQGIEDGVILGKLVILKSDVLLEVVVNEVFMEVYFGYYIDVVYDEMVFWL